MITFFGRTLTYLIPVIVFLGLFATSFFVVSADTWGAEGGNNTGVPGTNDGVGGVNPGSPNGTQSLNLVNPLKSDTIEAFIFAIIDIILVFALPIVIFFIMYAGFLYTTARGNVSQIEQAHTALLWALIGGVVVLGAKVIVEVVQGTVEGLQL